MAFAQSQLWREATTTICREGESPDDLGALRQAVRLLRLRGRFDGVVTMGPRPSLAYGLLCALLRLPSKQVMTEIFLDAPRPAAPVWRMKTTLFRWISRRGLGILTNSSAEVGLIARRLGIPEGNLRFVPMYTTIAQPGMVDEDDGSVVSIGRTLRDLDTLFAAAPQIEAPLTVVAGPQDRLPSGPPPRMTVLREIPMEEAHRRLRRAAVVVLPLLPAERSTGQVVMFEAMALGKPVVATRVAGTVDYIRDGENGLLVEPGDAAGLADAVNRLLRNPAWAHQLAACALEECLAQWMPEHHARRKIDAIAELVESERRRAEAATA